MSLLRGHEEPDEEEGPELGLVPGFGSASFAAKLHLFELSKKSTFCIVKMYRFSRSRGYPIQNSRARGASRQPVTELHRRRIARQLCDLHCSEVAARGVYLQAAKRAV